MRRIILESDGLVKLFLWIDLTKAVNHDLLPPDDDTIPEPAREAMVPMDSEMLGLEDKMSADVIDMRPDRFLRAIRDKGDWATACEAAGFTLDEVEDLCRVNPKFDLAQVECQLEYHEEQIIAAMEAAITAARHNRETRIADLRRSSLAMWRERHPQQEASG